MPFTDTCPPCGTVFTAESRDELVDAVITHARDAHDHELTREHVVAHIDGRDPHAGDG